MNNAHLDHTSKHFCDALRMIHKAPQPPEGNAEQSFHIGKTACLIHSCSFLHQISWDLRRDLCLIEWALSC